MSLIFDPPLIKGKLLKRYKRFLVDVELEDGSVLTAHCPNSGSMLDINQSGLQVWIQATPHTKLSHKLQFVEKDGILIGANTHNANSFMEHCLQNHLLPSLFPMQSFRREVKYGQNSRIDFLLTQKDESLEYVEVKSVHYQSQGIAMFPDSHSERATKHLHELMSMIKAGHKATVVFVIQRPDCLSLSPAWHIDPEFSQTLVQAHQEGVRMLALSCTTSPLGLEFLKQIPILLRKERS